MMGVMAKLRGDEKDGAQTTAQSVTSSDDADLARMGYKSEFARGTYRLVNSPSPLCCVFARLILTLFCDFC